MAKNNSQKPLRILLVEDSPTDAALLQEHIQVSGVDNLRVNIVDSLNKAIKYINNNNVDATLLDLSLPDSSGLETLTKFRKASPDMVVVVLTGTEDERTGIDTVRLGAQDYLIKGQTEGRVIARSVRYAIERKQAEDAVKKATRRFELLSEIANMLLQSKNPQNLINSLCIKVMEHLDCQLFLNYLLDEKTGRLHLNAYEGLKKQQAQSIEWFDIGTSVCGCVAMECKRIIVENIPENHNQEIELIHSFGIKAYACFPLLAFGNVLGTLSFGTKNRTAFSEGDLALIRTVADQVSTAMERIKAEEMLCQSRDELELRVQERTKQLKVLTTQLALVEERERRRIAGDLHDSVGQLLAFASRELKALKKNSQNKLSDSLNEVCSKLDEAIQQTRTLSFDLSPSILYDLGLEVAIEDLTERFCNERKIKFRFESIPGPKPLSEDLRIILYRAVRELLINIAKHAQAHAVRVSLGKSDSEILITVEDDGRGFDAVQMENMVGRPHGFGIFSIRERLGHAGGRLEIKSEKGKGTKVVLAAPLSQ